MFKETLSKFFKVDNILGNLTGYVETRVELLKIEVKEDVAKGLAQAISYLLLAFIFGLFLVFISVALALLIGERLGNFAGFSIVAGVYLIMGIIAWSLRKKLLVKLEERLSPLLRKKQ